MTPTPERRRTPRSGNDAEHGIVSARVRPGRDVSVVNVSADGALIETDRRLLPGASIELQFTTRERRASMRGRVVRCSVSRLRAADIWYRGAICFDRSVPWFAGERDGYGVPGAEISQQWPPRGDATPGVL
jgi:PilZ domain